MQGRHTVTNAQWARIRNLLPPERNRPGRPASSNRRMVNAILWVLKTGAPWRDLPRKYGPWQTAYGRFRRWSQRGVWDKVFQQVSRDQDSESWLIDATIVRAHQDASGAKKGIRKPSAAAEAVQVPRFTLS